MKKILFLIAISCFGLNTMVKADEGKWLLMLLNKNESEMKKLGCKLTAKDIYDVNKSSLKDAIVQFGPGCTGEIISEEGLLLTNHHCGYPSIQQQSSVEHDYLTNGFWAYDKSQELPCEGLTVKFLVRMDDVTAKVKAALKDGMSEQDRNKAIAEISKKLETEATQGTHYTANVKSFFDGNEFYIFIYEIYEDIRMVGAPPSSIGKYGADADNWMWPRHTGDFSMFRIYMSPDGKPAKYAKENVPFKPKRSLTISLAGVKKNDYSMILGYPGSTDRFLTSYGIESALKDKNPTIVKIRRAKLDVMQEYMNADPATRIQYASKYAQTANYWKYFIGQSTGLKNLNVYQKKKDLEDAFVKWANQTPENKAKYGNVINDISSAYAQLNDYEVWKWYFMEDIRRGAEIFTITSALNGLTAELKKSTPDQQKIKEAVANIRTVLEPLFKNYNVDVDKKLLSTTLDMYFRNVPIEQQPKDFLTMSFQNSYNYTAIANDIFKNSMFCDLAKINNFLNKPNLQTIENDPAYKLNAIFMNNYMEINKNLAPANEKLAQATRLFVEGIREMDKNKNYSPNANSTMRLTYGQILDYKPKDAVLYDYKTTLTGAMQKEDPNNPDFNVPAKLKELYNKKDFGRYAENGDIPVCFISNNDITGGNSGSPMLNGKGELIGCAFDGNWEAMSGDIAFEPNLQRTIGVDIRYVLFIIDKYANATNLIKEMKIVGK